jgi:hypothetical protein
MTHVEDGLVQRVIDTHRAVYGYNPRGGAFWDPIWGNAEALEEKLKELEAIADKNPWSSKSGLQSSATVL